MPLLLLLICALPFIELWLMIRIGASIGALPTIALLILAGAIGINLLRHQSLRTAWQVQQRLQAGELPAEEVIGGMLLALAGLFLLIPGFLTDIVALPLLLPPVRRMIARRLLPAMSMQGNGIFYRYERSNTRYSHTRQGDIIEGEVIASDSVAEGEFSEKKLTHSPLQQQPLQQQPQQPKDQSGSP